MSINIIVPSLGESVTEATIAKWHKQPGESVAVDELLLELETEKVTLEVSSPASGVLSKIVKNQGDVVAMGEIVGHITEGAVGAATTKNVTTQNIDNKIAEVNMQKINPANTLPPSVQKIVTENNLDPANISGSGKGGRITKGDAIEALSVPTPVASSPMPSSASTTNNKAVERVKMSRLRKTIAQRLKDSQNTAAILTTFNEIDMTNVITLRQKYREEFEKKHGIKLGFMSFFVKATVEALKAIPSVNAEIDGDDIVYKNYYDIGVAVGTEQGLVVPVVRNASDLSFAGVETEIVNLSKKAKAGKLSMADLSGGTFTISNGGVYGSLLSTPIINPPQSGILGLHKTQERPVAIGGKVEIRQMMYIALSYDHRIIDGKEAVTFLIKVKEAIENPERLLLNL
ncbi:Dihydrolipoyllysine-residue succinyltransferase component of 2-oxoglutarate dehydrogenase complex [Candidatus Trichorickettsia mobilis]|uniref:Dihydrolipoyllysine-residue succinyltransferase component of 2-oxoglutarate dehydrogenase complex n=1 Tax=Candidatus Trichorickettsia mobilis TaxID=1346319 RepID=A0ABZ0USS4_9RICK|nr:2-oxoglutarate dehydrogenase complex dihydrolipoyllysine-residue succinyltransferase [Candidatus Trichorickettsia mobilis]WPY01083.1 Dihydrolipoyllysine-residue succinyltransferase component of 2-oxoglutarate dehydrogenase complex [Candidatus Trichorickettsia mobilis]